MSTKKEREETVNETTGEYTHIAVVLDRSGSMGSTLEDTIGGFNTFLEDQKKQDEKATISIYQFDDQYDAICEMQDIGDCVGLNRDIYVPRGMTALRDAICRTINNTSTAIDAMDEDNQPDKVICVIITDGGENASRNFSATDTNDIIAARREEDWEFVFIGANQDSFAVGGGMGIRAGSTANYEASDIGTQVMYSGLSKNMTSFRGMKSAELQEADLGFFELDEDAPKENAIDASLSE